MSDVRHQLDDAAVKAASTAAVAADTALVVAISPNNTVPANQTQVGSTNVNAFPAGFQRTTDEPRQIFYDPFDAALDTTNRWAAPTSAGGGVAASTTAGVMSLGSGTTANGYSYLTSQPSFVPTIPAWLGFSFAISIESAVGNNAVRFWGAGTVGGTPSSASPLGTTGNGYGFEIDIAGVLQAVVYAAGVRTVVASLAAFQPADALNHRYIVYYRTDKIYWYVDGLGSAQLAATSSFQSPTVQTQPQLLLAVAHSTGPAASRAITCTGLATWDTGKNATQIADGTFPWRKASISAAGALSVAGAVTNAGTFAVQSAATLAAETTKVIGTVNVAAAQSIAVTQAAAANLNATVTQATLTKGTQGATGVSTQDLKDAGRSARTLTLDGFAIAATGETIMTMSYSSDNGTLTTGTSYQVTAAKRLRIQQITLGLHTITGNTTAASIIIRVRALAAGTAIVSSPVQAVFALPGSATANMASSITIPFPDGWEFVAATGIAITAACAGFAATTSAPKLDIAVTAYEY